MHGRTKGGADALALQILRVSNFIHPLEDQSPFFRGQFTVDCAEARYHHELLKIFFGVGFRFGLWPWIVGLPCRSF